MGFKTPNPLNMPKEDVQLSCSKKCQIDQKSCK